MQRLKLAVFCALALAAGLAWGDTLTFIAQADQNGVVNHDWFEIGNWFLSDGNGGFIPAGRLPQQDDTVVITGAADGDQGTVRVQTLVTSASATLTNGTYSMEDVQMLDGSHFGDTTLFLLGDMDVAGANCTFSNTDLTILFTATLTIGSTQSQTSADLTLSGGSLIKNMGHLSLIDGSQLIAGGSPQSEIDIQSGAALDAAGRCAVRGSGDSPLVLDHNGIIRSTGGTLLFEDSIDWRCSGGSQFFDAAASNALISFETPFIVGTATTSVFTGPGTSLLSGGGTLDGTLRLGGNDPLAQSFSAGNLAISGPVAGAGQLQVTGMTNQESLLTWSDGALSFSNIAIGVDGQMLIAGDAHTPRQLSGCSVSNSGLCTMLSGFALDDAAQFDNLTNAVFQIQNDGAITSAGSAPGLFNNLGRVVKTSPGRTQFGSMGANGGPAFNNYGLVKVEGGELCLLDGSSAGTFQTASGATLWFWGGTHSLQTGAALTGPGMVQVEQGVAPAVLAVAEGVTADELAAGLNGSVVGVGSATPNPIRIADLFMQANGMLTNGNFALGSAQMLDNSAFADSAAAVSNSIVIAGTNCLLDSAALTIQTNAEARLAPVAPGSLASLTLTSGSRLDVQGQISLTNGAHLSGLGLPVSTLRIWAGSALSSGGDAFVSGSTNGGLILDNSGTIQAGQGTLEFDGGIQWQSSGGTSTFLAAAPTALLQFLGQFKAAPNVTAIFQGPGTSRLAGDAAIDGQAQVGGAGPQTQAFAPGNLEIAGLLGGRGSLAVLGSQSAGSLLSWSGGSISLRSVAIASGAEMLIGPLESTPRTLAGSHVSNNGSVIWTGPEGMAAGGGAVLDNSSTGLIDVQTDTTLGLLAGQTPQLIINNAGTFLKSGGSGSSAFSSDFNNTGLLHIQSGNFVFSGAWQQTAGDTLVDTGAGLGAGDLKVRGGTLSGGGLLDANLSNSGAVQPGASPGTMTIQPPDDYQQSSTGTLAIQIGGATLGTQYDELAVGGAAALDGTLDVRLINGFVPKVGDTFQILTCASLTGAFSGLTGQSPPGTVWVARYSGTNVTLTLATGVAAEKPAISGGNLKFSIDTQPGLTYLVQATESLSPPDWQTLATLRGDGTRKNFSDPVVQPQRYYRVIIQ
jgi:hypothetical protein